MLPFWVQVLAIMGHITLEWSYYIIITHWWSCIGLTCDGDPDDTRRYAGGLQLIVSGCNCTPVLSCITVLDIGNDDVSWSIGSKAHRFPINGDWRLIFRPWVGDTCPWLVRCVAGEGSGGTYLGWALTHRWGGYGSRNCVGRRRRNGEVGEGEGGGGSRNWRWKGDGGRGHAVV